jgi:capsule polysaccharide export protein KpsE/RkpR
MLPHRYTATASILIEPPAGNDPRGATAVSPIYLESLKTYEHLASADTLFTQAVDHLSLRDTNKRESLESLKNRVLRVSKLRDTKILKISATLSDPAKAQALAEYIARRSADLNRSLNDQSERDLSEQARRFTEAAAARLHKAEQARNDFLIQSPIVGLEDERAANLKLKSQIQSDLSYAKAELAQYEAQLARSSDGAATPAPATLRQGIVSERANIRALEEQAQRLDQQLTENAALLERRKHQRDRLDSELGSARAQFESASTKTNDILSSSAFRGERLDVIDPGVVPQRPSSPNLSLNVVLAFSVSLVGWLLYVTVGFSYSRQLLARQGSSYEAE